MPKQWPRVTDNDNGEITVSLGERELRGYTYTTDVERRYKMVMAREYVEGWGDGHDNATTHRIASDIRDELLK